MYKDDKNQNAEVEIDYEKKKVRFNYTTKVKNIDLGYFRHNVTQLIQIVLMIIGYIYIAERYETDNTLESILYKLCILVMYIIGTIYLTGMLSIFLHRNIKWLRENYAKTNVIIKPRWKIIDLKEERIENVIKIGKQVIILDYSIVYFEYKYVGENKIRKIKTIDIDEQREGKERYNFALIIEFNKKANKGILMYR